MMVLGALIKHRVALAEIKREANTTSVDPTIFNSIKKRYQDTWALYQKVPKINAYEVQIPARYKHATVLSALDTLGKAIVNFQKSISNKEIRMRMVEVNVKFDKLANTMATEVARNEL